MTQTFSHPNVSGDAAIKSWLAGSLVGKANDVGEAIRSVYRRPCQVPEGSAYLCQRNAVPFMEREFKDRDVWVMRFADSAIFHAVNRRPIYLGPDVKIRAEMMGVILNSNFSLRPWVAGTEEIRGV